MSKFIVFEGLDCSGKTTQAMKLKSLFTNRGVAVFSTSEPTDLPFGRAALCAIREGSDVAPEALALVFAADRVWHYEKHISPGLDAGYCVVCDRYYYSSLAYQGITQDTMARILLYNQAVLQPPARRPDVVFFLDTSPEVCAKRAMTERTECSIYENLSQMRRLRKSYFEAFRWLGAGENIMVIDTSGKTADDITNIVTSHPLIVQLLN